MNGRSLRGLPLAGRLRSDTHRPSIDISGPDFLRFARASYVVKRSLVRRLKATVDQAYDPGTDQFRRVRQAIQREAVPDADTPGEFVEALAGAHERRRESFRRLLEGYLNFAATHDVARASVPRLEWTYGRLRVTIRPHLALVIAGEVYVIRFHYGTAPAAGREALPILQLLHDAGAAGVGRPALLDLRRGALVAPRLDGGVARTLRSEAAELVRLWGSRS